MQKLLKGGSRRFGIVEIVFVDFADGEQPVEAVLAAGILAAQKFILLDRLIQDFVVVETPSHFHQRLGHGNHAGISFGRSGRSQIDER